ncbi:MAG: hypothetical protein KA053_05445 [Lentimicrobiaceae bacterium]|nr:hypothetical protein [Lentimicrobiaceae bacterium]
MTYLHPMNTLKPARTLIRMLILLMIISTACSSGRPTRKQREVARIQNERQKEATKKYHDAVKRHHSIQDKETRKRIKKGQRDARRNANENRIHWPWNR